MYVYNIYVCFYLVLEEEKETKQKWQKILIDKLK